MDQDLRIGAIVRRKGYVTKANFMRGKPSDRLEQELGFEAGRLRDGWWLLFLLQAPTADQFEYRGYTQMSGGVSMGHLAFPPDPRTAERRLADEGHDLSARKAGTITNILKLQGIARIAKVIPVVTGSVYPPGLGQPQWELMDYLPFRVAARIADGEMYMGDYA